MVTRTGWWRESVIYQVYPRSFFDTNGDGEGDLAGVSAKLNYIKSLGADAIWLSPFYISPNKDGGYDVANPRDVDPRFGTLADAKSLFEKAHQLGLKILIDIVPNHFSDQHKWFQEALKSSAGSPERSRFHFYDEKSDGNLPNNWISLFGGPAWTRVESADGSVQHYLHLFDSTQPDLNWENQDVINDFESTLRFWIELGADGFRIDVAHGLIKEEILVNHPSPQRISDALRLDVDMPAVERSELLASVPFFDREGVHNIYRQWRNIFDSYDREIIAVAEAWVHPPIKAMDYVRPDELQQVFNFDLLVAPFEAKFLFNCINNTLQMLSKVSASATWALSNHDTPRLASRHGADAARALALFVMALPGSFYIYNGQELGLPDAELRDSDRQDPTFLRTNGQVKGRDGARVPMPWSGAESPFAFSTGKPWLPIPESWKSLTVDSQSGDISSSLSLYQQALTLRRELLTDSPDIEWVQRGEAGVISFLRGGYGVYLNTGAAEAGMAVDAELAIASSSLVEISSGTLNLPPATAAWVKPY